MWDPQFSDVVARACKIRVPLCCLSQEDTMLTSRNNDPRWILATIVESGNRRFWGWHTLFFVTFFLLLFFLRTWNQNFFFAFARENSPVQPLLVSGSLGRKAIPRRRHSMLSSQLLLGGFSHQGIPSSSHPKSYPGHGYLVRLPPRPPTDQLLFYTVHIWLRTACTFVNSFGPLSLLG